MRSIPISKYFEFKKPNYIYLKLTPSTAIRNYNSDQILKLIASLYKSITQQIKKINNKLFFECSSKVSFYIYLEKTKVEFYFIVPETQFLLFKEKLINTWNNKITINIVPNIPTFNQDCTKYYLTYKKEDAMSLSTDKRNNTLLENELSTLYVMEEGDRAGVFYNFIPTYQKGWKAKYDGTIKSLNEGMPILRNKMNLLYIAYVFATRILYVIDVVFESVNLGSPKKETKRDYILLDDTKHKRDSAVVDTQIICFSQAQSKARENSTAISLCQAFECLNGDNELVYKRLHNKNINLLDTKIQKADRIKIQPKEGQNFLSMPGLGLLDEYKVIEHTEVLECEVPEELQKGIVCIGVSKYKDKEIKAFLPTNDKLRNLSLVVIGPTRAGKTTLFSNLANDYRNGGECSIILDFCGNCELTESVTKDLSNVKVIDCSDHTKLQGLGFNEADTEDKDPFNQYQNIKIKASQLLTLVDAVNSEDRDLKAKMNKFLNSAALIVFSSNGSIKDVFSVLQNHKIRKEYINRIPRNLYEYLDEYIDTINEINDVKNGEIIGTKYNTAITGIMDRVGQLKQNTYMELMLKKDCSKNFNLLEEIQKNQIICFKIPEHMFPTENEKDTYCTYWMSKIWLAIKIRNSYLPKDKHIKVNVFIDELSQVPNCEELVRSKLSQMAKFNCKMILSCHYLNQLKIIREELKSASSSYMFISGCDKVNYNEMKEELAPYTVNDMLKLKEFNSLNLIKVKDGYAKFVTKLPKPL